MCLTHPWRHLKAPVSFGLGQASVSLPAMSDIEWSGDFEMIAVVPVAMGAEPAWIHNDCCLLLHMGWFCAENHL